MRLAAAVSFVLVLVVSVSALGEPARPDAYGPCCPRVKGQKAPVAQPRAGGAVLVGPRNVCQTRAVSLVYETTTHSANMVEVNGSLLCPARLFTMAGAQLQWGGARHLALVLGPRRVALTLGSHDVTITEGGDARTVRWALCPRLLNGITYAPLRPLAEALGLSVDFNAGVVVVGDARAGAAAAPQPTTCPADRVERALGVVVVRSPADSALGAGIGIVEVGADGLAAQAGVQPRDVIIECNGTRVRCPKDLDDLLTQAAQRQAKAIQQLTVARGSEKLLLQAP
jgi:hypothetical protein